MRLDSIHIHQFGGLRDARTDFGTGLTAVVGDNDVGKSTLYEALLHTLTTATTLHKRSFGDEIERFIPLGGGDHARVQLKFSVDGEAYTLEKTWSVDKKVRKATLTLPDGTAIASDDAVTEKLEALLPAPAGTVRTILMTYQAGLRKVAEEFDPDSLTSLDDTLRSAVAGSSGFSVSRFEEVLKQELDEVGSHWDFDADRPEKKKGKAQTRWAKEIGDILQASYDHEDAEEAYKEAAEAEEALDHATRELSAAETQLEETETYLNTNKTAFEALSNRKLLTARLESAKSKLEATTKLYGDWTKAEIELGPLKLEIPQLELAEADLRKKRDELTKAKKGEALRTKLKEAERHADAVARADEHLKGIPELSDEVLKAIESANDKTRQAEVALGSGKLSLSFHAKEDQELGVTKDLEPKETKRVFAHKTLEIAAGGRISLDHEAWAITVTSGEGDVERLSAEYTVAKNERDELLRTHSAKDVPAAREANRAFTAATTTRRQADTRLSEALGDLTLEALRTDVAELGPAVDLSAESQVITDHTKTEAALGTKKARLAELTGSISAWQKQHESSEAVVSVLAECKSEAKKCQKERDKLPAPPSELSEDEFDSAYKAAQQRRERLMQTQGERRSDVRSATEQLGEVTSEELKAQLASTKRVFDAQLRRGAALVRIQEAIGEIADDPSGAYAGMLSEIGSLFAKVSGNRYAAPWTTDDDGFLPDGFVRQEDSVRVPIDIMSHGMRDAVALACRIAMARYFLGEADGFLIMDDPLVNLDAKRKAQAVAILKDVAKDKQTIVFTCHQDHAKALTKEIVGLGGGRTASVVAEAGALQRASGGRKSADRGRS